MMANENVDQIIQRTYRYFYRDGLVEVLMGALFVIIAGGLLLVYTSSGMRALPLLGLALAAVMIALALGSKWLLGWLKERLTYPRTGYVSYRSGEPSIGRWVPIVGALVLVALILLLPQWFNSMAVMEGGLMALILIAIAYRVGLTRLYVVGVLSVLIGVGAARVQLGDVAGSALAFGGIGVLLIISGGLALIRYLANNPLPQKRNHD